MPFIPGKSGNAAGRPKGACNRRTRLAQLLEPHAEELIAKLVDLARGGDVQALRLVIERLIPKADHAPLEVDLPQEINFSNLSEVKNMILVAALEGKMNVGDAERLVTLVSNQYGAKPIPVSLSSFPTDPNEAARTYRNFMRDS